MPPTQTCRPGAGAAGAAGAAASVGALIAEGSSVRAVGDATRGAAVTTKGVRRAGAGGMVVSMGSSLVPILGRQQPSLQSSATVTQNSSFSAHAELQ